MVRDILEQGLKELGLDPAPAPQLERYGQLLVEKNQVMNLTAITDPVEVAQKHMLDCAALLGGKLLPAYTYQVPGTDLVRRVIRVEKIAPTPGRYPRRFAKIQKAPP